MKLLKDHHIAEVKMSYSSKIDIKTAPQINGSVLAAQCFSQSWEGLEYIETFKVMLLNRANRVKGILTVSTGGTTSCIVDNKIILQAAILSNSTSLIICHNHPSGNLTPSDADIKVTNLLKQACTFQDIALLDHIILAPDGFYSFADEGRL